MKDITCANCGHLLYRVSMRKYEHYTRFYRPAFFPYTTIKCHAGECECRKPEGPKPEVTLKRSDGDNYTIVTPDVSIELEMDEMIELGRQMRREGF